MLFIENKNNFRYITHCFWIQYFFFGIPASLTLNLKDGVPLTLHKELEHLGA